MDQGLLIDKRLRRKEVIRVLVWGGVGGHLPQENGGGSSPTRPQGRDTGLRKGVVGGGAGHVERTRTHTHRGP